MCCDLCDVHYGWSKPVFPLTLVRIWNESGSIGLLLQIISLINVNKTIVKGIHDRTIKTNAMTNNVVTLVTSPMISHIWGKQLDYDDDNWNVSVVICDSDIRSPDSLCEILSNGHWLLCSYLESSSGERNQLIN